MEMLSAYEVARLQNATKKTQPISQTSKSKKLKLKKKQKNGVSKAKNKSPKENKGFVIVKTKISPQQNAKNKSENHGQLQNNSSGTNKKVPFQQQNGAREHSKCSNAITKKPVKNTKNLPIQPKKVVKTKKNTKKQEVNNKNLSELPAGKTITSNGNESDCSDVPELVYFPEHESESMSIESDEEYFEDHVNPIEASEEAFNWLVYPIKPDTFMKDIWEQKPLHVRRNKPKYFSPMMSTPLLDQLLRDNYIMYSKNLDITSYSDGIRETHNPPGRALPSVVWDYYLNGCSVRMLNPQTFIPIVHKINSALQEYFGCFVGANSYLTPPNSQGFAPHYDDIEAFILQIEGKKRWRLYKSRNKKELHPRYSSPNFSQEELGEPIFDDVIHAGDLLYLPRGTIHQGDTFGSDEHSLHITLSVYQNNSWADFLEKLLPNALKNAIENEPKFRQGLPLHYLKHVGEVYKNKKHNNMLKEFVDKTKSLVQTVFDKYLNVHEAADQMAKNHIHDFLPPMLDKSEAICTVQEGGEKMIENGEVVNRVEIEPDNMVRLIRHHCARLVREEGVHKLYYSSENSKEYHEYDIQFVEVDEEFVPAIKKLITVYPQFIKVDHLPIKDIVKKVQLVRDLWEKNIVITEVPLPALMD
ncbi:unnamed protein product [Trichogramma brassicae]|uniref:Bifunctional lysine-specific demethylase and histidyl-hydroxylase n=1 Tax=Trichogramma brassicae TaxID=86971 RepID=A0A6H5IL82_9HYME|nr:unnamed protein product [Trichogramma brassicae]